MMDEIKIEDVTRLETEIARLKRELELQTTWKNVAHAEIERLTHTATDLQRECEKRGSKIADLERLVIRAADTLLDDRLT